MKAVVTAVFAMCIAAGTVFAWPGEKWDTTLTLGLNASSGNSETLLGTAGLETGSESETDQVKAQVSLAYGTQDSDTTTQNAKITSTYRRKLDRMFGYLDGSLQHDDIADVSYRILAGLGGGYFLKKTDAVTLSVEAGLGYLVEEVASIEDDYLTLRVAQELAWTVADGAKVWQSLEVLPKAEDMGNVLLNAEVGIESAISGTLSLRVVLQDRYDSEPAAESEENDLSLVSALTWKI